MIPGIDVSRWQREIDWREVKRSGVKFAFIKATEFPDKTTSLLVDQQLEKNIKGAIENSIYWGAYHYFRTHIDPVVQAKIFCGTVGPFISLPPVIELEFARTRGERLNYKVKLFLDEVESITGRRPIIYTSSGFWRSYMCYEKQAHADWAREYPLWAAQYTSLWPTALYPWAGWDFWQYSDKGRIPGIETGVGMNWFNGSENDLVQRFVYQGKEENISDMPIMVDSAQAKFISNTKKIAENDNSPTAKNDFQEPNRQHRHEYSPRSEMHFETIKALQENGGNSREEVWIRDYFCQTA